LNLYSSKYKWAQRILLVTIVYFVGNVIVNQVSQIQLSDLNISIKFILLSFIFEIGARLFVGIGYYKLLCYFGFPLSFILSIAISWISFIGKYFPGKVALIASAFYFFRQQKVPSVTAGLVPVLNTLLTVFTALIFSIPLVLKNDQSGGAFFYLGPFLIIGVLFFLKPTSFFAIINLIFKRFGISKIRSILTSSQIGHCFVIVGIQCVLAGISTWLICKSIFFPLNISLLPVIISITAFSGTMGILAFFSPAGIGVRDGLFYINLSLITGSENAAVIVIILRLIHTVIDIVTAAIGFILLKMNQSLSIRKNNE